MEQQKLTTPQTIIVVNKQKSAAIAILLTIFFGPLGLLYSSVIGGVVMIILGLVIGLITFGIGLVVVWVGSIIWAAVAVAMINKKQDKLIQK